jgi:putative restriction endonuclease
MGRPLVESRPAPSDTAAYSPDLVVDLWLDVLREADGPMLLHGLQGFQGVRIAVPREPQLQPNRDWLAERYEIFARAS